MTTISARLFEYEGLKAELRPDEKIAIFSCDNCARRCDGLGGRKGLTTLADKLTADGFSVVCRELFRALCSRKHLLARLEVEECQELLIQVDLILPLACEAGTERVRELLPDHRVLETTKTLGIGITRPETGVRLVKPAEGLILEVDATTGLSLHEAAQRLGLYPGSF